LYFIHKTVILFFFTYCCLSVVPSFFFPSYLAVVFDINFFFLNDLDSTVTGEGVNIWEEGVKGNITYNKEPKFKGEIMAATLNKLIEKLTPEKNVDLQYLNIFLNTYTSFTTAEIVLLKLMQRYLFCFWFLIFDFCFLFCLIDLLCDLSCFFLSVWRLRASIPLFTCVSFALFWSLLFSCQPLLLLYNIPHVCFFFDRWSGTMFPAVLPMFL